MEQYNLNKLSSNQIYQILDEIPSGPESEDDLSDCSDEENSNNDHTCTENIEGQIPEISDYETDLEFDEEDEVPLSVLASAQVIDRWKKSIFKEVPNKFTEHVGPKNIPLGCHDPVDIFLLLFNFIEDIVFQTNLYAIQKGDYFAPTNEAEMKCFIGINLLLGIKEVPSYKDCWSSYPQLRDEYISNLMSLNRFSLLLSHIHLNDNSLLPSRQDASYDKLYKIRPFIEQLKQNFQNYYGPTMEQAVDETMVKFKGRISFKQYMPLKPIKRGYKIWVRADLNGYVCDFDIYTGKSQDREGQLGEDVVKKLTASLYGKYYHIYFDIFLPR